MDEVDFWFDVVCPYAWAASARVAWLQQVTGVRVRWRPILLGGVFRAHGSPDVPAAVMSPARARAIEADAQASGARVGLTVRYPDAHPRRTVEAMRLLTAAPPDRVPALAQDLWSAYWTDGADIADRAVLAPIAARHGVQLDRIDAPEIKQALRDSTEQAVARGVFGVPTFTAGPLGPDGPQVMVWGADRLPALASALGAPVPPRLPHGPIEVFHDFASPYSYLGVAALLQAGRQPTLRPMLLGALFKQIGTPLVPIATFVAAKQRYIRRDLEAQAAWRGLPFRFASTFPMNTVSALRVALIEPRATLPLYQAVWVQDLDLGQPSVLVQVLDGAGFDGAGLVEQTADPSVKAQLHANTGRAVALGVVGAPSFLADGVVHWGQDRLDALADREAAPT